ncbi:MAG TPA: glycoside hydrolase domain-containing protein [Segeticoccus sp.]|uniref:glycoside hydrolase domain-containing protein n=1 Tax=Segeticoccus sp. TaxID=2706531 RepID=UPI002D7E7F0E|nr:glycoside hydrolase domain-containing protein [Segeticoccus sp.]HET8598953.1 glycoside hydrolase domain-containing protein [Segeticoccus sp.]
MARLRRPVTVLVAAAAALFPYAGSLPSASAAPAAGGSSGGSVSPSPSSSAAPSGASTRPSPATPSTPAATRPSAATPSAPAATRSTPAATPSGPAGPTKQVAYHGVSVQVPADWPVVDLDRDPTACVRFDVQAVYLGEPGEQQDCPAHAVGRADTVWLRDSDAASAQVPMARAHATRLGALPAQVQTQDLTQTTEAELPGRGVSIQTTWADTATAAAASHGKGRVDRVLETAQPTNAKDTTAPRNPEFHARAEAPARPLPPKSAGATNAPGVLGNGAVAATNAAASFMPAGTSGGTVARGMGFDACAAPSASTMQAWLKSPYRSVGIYIGGSMRACGDGNLSASWVNQVTGMGWGLIPIYVGRQAPCVQQGGLAHISTNPSTAAAQGQASADDAVQMAQKFGLGRGAPIYYDMEMYSTNNSTCSQAVMTFLSAWSARLHGYGYRSGAYGGDSSLMRDLNSRVGTSGFTLPDDLWSANWNGLQTTYSPDLPDSRWSRHQRLHQYASGSERWGGITLSIDANYLDGHVAGPARPPSYGTRTYGPGSREFRFTGNMSYWRPNATSGVTGMAYWTHPSASSTEANGATWSPSLGSGLYRVQVNVPSSYANAPNVKYTVTHATGTTTTYVDQSAVGGWVTLGSFYDRPGHPLSLHASDNGSTKTSTYIGIDAARFQLLATAPSAPGGVSGKAGDGQATVSWNAASPNGRTVDRYQVQASPGGASVSTSGSARQATLTGLTNGTAYSFRVRAHNAVGWSAWSAWSSTVTPAGLGHFTAVTPVRIVDTRRGMPANSRSTALGAHASMTIRVAGVSGSPVPRSATTAALNVTVTRPGTSGGVYVGDASDGTDTISFTRGLTLAHGLVTRLRSNGTLTVVNHSGSTVQVIVDVRGYATPASSGNYHPVTPTRLTRPSGTTSNPTVKSLGAYRSVKVRVAGVAGSPVPKGVRAVALNVTAGNPGRGGYLRVSDDGAGESALNFRKGVNVANFVLSKVASDGTVTIANRSGGRMNLYVDVEGYVTGSNTGDGWMPTSKQVVFNTMTGTSANPRSTAIPAWGRVTVNVAGARGTGVPGSASSVALNVRVNQAPYGGWLYVGPVDGTGTSTLNFPRGASQTNFLVSRVNSNGDVVIANHSRRAINVSLDALGYAR